MFSSHSFDAKKDGTWYMCVDSKAINNITIKYKFHIPILDDMLNELYLSKLFSKIDFIGCYLQIKMKEGYEWKIAFKIKYGLSEWPVMPFVLFNTSCPFLGLMNEV